jgi:hypothetical protein
VSGAASEIPVVEASAADPEQPAEDVGWYLQRFHKAGLPLFDEDFKASTDVFNRAVPLLGLVFLGELVGAVQLEWSLGANLAALAGGLAILIGGIGIANRLGGRPFLSRPRRVGKTELAAFVLVPALLPLIFGGQTTSAWVTALANVALLGLIYAVYGYGLLSIVGWVFIRLRGQLRSSLLLLARAVPLVMIFGLLAFLSDEMWQVFAGEPIAGLVMVGMLFLLLGSAFLLARLPREVRALEADVETGSRPLNTRQRRNVGLVLFMSQAMQVLAVTLMVALFFIVFGVLAITASVSNTFLPDYDFHVLVTISMFGSEYELTVELLKVAGALAAFSGLYFAVAMLTDSTYREEFLDEVTAELRQTFRDRAAYLKLRGNRPGLRSVQRAARGS